ncbi:chitinase-3-like protein 1 [Anopheles gambiae]|uniref:chitinase-3-like protein 1 n=1 Tax=Anopheles gambiae TaxID=7165 RepID=UPI002AC9DD7D|nr:chitinase-3-like protein 1 [Anopheles gambiae]
MAHSVPLWFILLVTACSLLAAVENRKYGEVVCYYGSWASGYVASGKFAVENINPALCTQLVYSFYNIKPDGTIVIPNEATFSEATILKLNDLKKTNPALKTLAAIGGYNAGTESFSKVAKTPELRTTFARNAAAFLKKYRFDGMDIDWEYPVAADKANFVPFLKELSTAFSPSKYLLTVAVGGTSFEGNDRYDIPAISKVVNFINLMTYDMQGNYGVTRHHAPLKQGPAALDNTDYKQALNAEAVIAYWLSKGAPANKLNLGIPFYGRSFKLAKPTVDGVGAPVSGVGTPGPVTRQAGSLAYYEICNSSMLTRKQYDSVQVGAFASGGGEWVSYDSVESIGQKCDVIAKYGLGGGMVWSIDMDDFTGKCGPKFALLTALNGCVNRKAPSATPATPSTPGTPSTPVVKPPSGQTGPFVCTRDGYFRDSQNCTMYYRCYNGGRVEHGTCPGGLYFNERLSICDYPSNVKC